MKRTRKVAGAFAVAREGSKSAADPAGDGEAAGDAAGEAAGAAVAVGVDDGDGEGAGAGDEQADRAEASAATARPRESVDVFDSRFTIAPPKRPRAERTRPGRVAAAFRYRMPLRRASSRMSLLAVAPDRVHPISRTRSRRSRSRMPPAAFTCTWAGECRRMRIRSSSVAPDVP